MRVFPLMIMNKNVVLLIIGIILSIGFIVGCSDIYPWLSGSYFDGDFDTAMYDDNFYLYVAVMNVLLSWAGAATFYYIINSVSFSRWYHWLIMLGGTSAIVGVLAYVIPDGTLYDAGYNFEGQLTQFAILNFVVALVMFVISSFSIRWWSSNCRHTPIPE